MSDRNETERKELVDRLRRERPKDAWFLAGYAGEGPPNHYRIYAPNRVRYVDVPDAQVIDHYEVPAGGPGRDVGLVLIVKPDAKIRVRRTIPADLLVGPIFSRLERLTEAAKCIGSTSRTPKHNPFSDWLHPDEPLNGAPDDFAPGPYHRRDARTPPIVT